MISHLKTIGVRYYRCFAQPEIFELRPLTLVYGCNNAGKSAMVRLVGLLADSLRETARAPLDFSGPAAGNATFREVEWKGKTESEPPGIWLELRWSDAPLRRASYRLDFHREWRRTYIRELDLDLDDGTRWHAEAQWGVAPDLYTVAPASSGRNEAEIRFTGLVPSGPSTTQLGCLAQQLVALRGSLQWLGGRRLAPPRLLPAEERPPATPGPDGAGATELLQADEELRETVAAWYARPEIHRTLRFKPDGSQQRLLLSPADAPFDIDFLDTGAGMAQVLPVLTAAALARRQAAHSPGAILSVEEPEAQLHPGAQRALGDWFSELVAAEPAPRLLLETHSRTFILGVQLAVATGRIDPARVLIYWLEQRPDGSTLVRPVELDSLGRPDGNWPHDVFVEERELARSLVEVQLSRRGAGR